MSAIDWNGFTKENYELMLSELEPDKYYGSVRVGELCFDVIIRDYENKGESNIAISFDCYVANENTGYGEKVTDNGEIIYYDFADGVDVFDLTLPYYDFVRYMINCLTNFIIKENKNHEYSLLDKASADLLIW